MSRLSEQDLDRLLDGESFNAEFGDQRVHKLARLRDAFAALQLSQQNKDDLAPQKILFNWDRLEVVAQIGAGGFGDVYRAWDPALARDVALKLRRADAGFAPSAGRAFLDEARRMARVRHPNVIAVHGAAIDAGRAGLWSELIEGETLQQQLERKGKLPESELLTLMKTLAEALAAVHAAGLVHGDIKPSNVIRDHLTRQYILMDFGAGAWLDEQGRAWLTSGSRFYMAPEHERGDLVDVSADIFALGAVIYAAAMGTTRLSEFNQVRQLPLQGCSVEFNYLLEKMLNEDNALRPDARHVAREAQRIIEEPARLKTLRVRRWVQFGLAASAVIFAFGFGIATWSRKQAEIERNRALNVQNFVLEMLRNPNPYQSNSPGQKVESMFESAVSELSNKFQDDPETAARLYQQFGRSLNILGRDDAALSALEKSESLLRNRVDPSHPILREARSNLADLYRTRQSYDQAISLAKQQMQLCQPKPTLPVTSCLAIFNDYIEAIGFSGDADAALKLSNQAIEMAQSSKLSSDYEAIFVYYLRGVWHRNLGHTDLATADFLLLTESTIRHAPATHPGLLTDLMWLSWMAFDMGDLRLAAELNQLARTGREKIFSPKSRYVIETHFQTAQILFANQQFEQAASEFRVLLNTMPPTKIFSKMREQTIRWLALCASDTAQVGSGLLAPSRSNQVRKIFLRPDQIENEFLLMASQLRRGQITEAQSTLSQIDMQSNKNNIAYLTPAFIALKKNIALRTAEATLAASLEIQLNEILQIQEKRYFDPVAGQWYGTITPKMRSRMEEIRLIARRVEARRFGSK